MGMPTIQATWESKWRLKNIVLQGLPNKYDLVKYKHNKNPELGFDQIKRKVREIFVNKHVFDGNSLIFQNRMLGDR